MRIRRFVSQGSWIVLSVSFDWCRRWRCWRRRWTRIHRCLSLRSRLRLRSCVRGRWIWKDGTFVAKISTGSVGVGLRMLATVDAGVGLVASVAQRMSRHLVVVTMFEGPCSIRVLLPGPACASIFSRLVGSLWIRETRICMGHFWYGGGRRFLHSLGLRATLPSVDIRLGFELCGWRWRQWCLKVVGIPSHF